MAKEARRRAAYSRLVGDNGLFKKRERKREREKEKYKTFGLLQEDV
jgi:hypothetical protein